MKNIFTVSFLRNLEHELDLEQITYSRFVEILNDLACFEYRVEGYLKLDDNKTVTTEEKLKYMMEYRKWDMKEWKNDFEKGMSQPNPPNYFRTNND